MPKWCTNCRTSTHDDKDCWSTRALLPEPPSFDKPFDLQLLGPDVFMAIARRCYPSLDTFDRNFIFGG